MTTHLKVFTTVSMLFVIVGFFILSEIKPAQAKEDITRREWIMFADSFCPSGYMGACRTRQDWSDCEGVFNGFTGCLILE